MPIRPQNWPTTVYFLKMPRSASKARVWYSAGRAMLSLVQSNSVPGEKDSLLMLEHAVTRRTGLLLVTALIFTTILVGCAADSAPAASGSGSGGVVIISNNATVVPTPTLPPYTIGAWVSNPSPTLNDTITVYAIVRRQPSNLATPPTPPNPPVSVTFSSNFFKAQTVQTDVSGIAAASIVAGGTPTQPVEIDVKATIGN